MQRMVVGQPKAFSLRLWMRRLVAQLGQRVGSVSAASRRGVFSTTCERTFIVLSSFEGRRVVTLVDDDGGPVRMSLDLREAARRSASPWAVSGRQPL
jgi:hypothetical protein